MRPIKELNEQTYKAFRKRLIELYKQSNPELSYQAIANQLNKEFQTTQTKNSVSGWIFRMVYAGEIVFRDGRSLNPDIVERMSKVPAQQPLPRQMQLNPAPKVRPAAPKIPRKSRSKPKFKWAWVSIWNRCVNRAYCLNRTKSWNWKWGKPNTKPDMPVEPEVKHTEPTNEPVVSAQVVDTSPIVEIFATQTVAVEAKVEAVNQPVYPAVEIEQKPKAEAPKAKEIEPAPVIKFAPRPRVREPRTCAFIVNDTKPFKYCGEALPDDPRWPSSYCTHHHKLSYIKTKLVKQIV